MKITSTSLSLRSMKSFSFAFVTALVLSPICWSCAGDRGNDSVESQQEEAELVEQIDQTMTEQAQEEQSGEVAGDMISPEE